MAIDTEFLREKTYYPKTCLVQIGIEGMIAIDRSARACELETAGASLSRTQTS